MEHNLMNVKDVAEYLRLSVQTIQRYVMNKEIPFHKVKTIIRFRFSEIEKWIDEGGGDVSFDSDDDRQGNLFAGEEAGANGEVGEPAAETGADVEAGKSANTRANVKARGTGGKGKAVEVKA
jgi:excisionase family DNA binding protein